MNSRHYTIQDLHYRSSLDNKTLAVTDAGAELEIDPPAKSVFIRNDGANDVFIEFDNPDQISTDSLKLTATDPLWEFEVQCSKLNAICAGGETATLRIGISR